MPATACVHNMARLILICFVKGCEFFRHQRCTAPQIDIRFKNHQGPFCLKYAIETAPQSAVLEGGATVSYLPPARGQHSNGYDLSLEISDEIADISPKVSCRVLGCHYNHDGVCGAERLKVRPQSQQAYCDTYQLPK